MSNEQKKPPQRTAIAASHLGTLVPIVLEMPDVTLQTPSLKTAVHPFSAEAAQRDHMIALDLGLAFDFARDGQLKKGQPLIKDPNHVARALRLPNRFDDLSHSYMIRKDDAKNVTDFAIVVDLKNTLGSKWEVLPSDPSQTSSREVGWWMQWSPDNNGNIAHLTVTVDPSVTGKKPTELDQALAGFEHLGEDKAQYKKPALASVTFALSDRFGLSNDPTKLPAADLYSREQKVVIQLPIDPSGFMKATTQTAHPPIDFADRSGPA